MLGSYVYFIKCKSHYTTSSLRCNAVSWGIGIQNDFIFLQLPRRKEMSFFSISVNGKSVSKPTEVKREIFNFYTELYSWGGWDRPSCSKLNFNILTPLSADLLELPFTCFGVVWCIPKTIENLLYTTRIFIITDRIFHRYLYYHFIGN